MERKRNVYFHTNLESESNIAINGIPLIVNAVGEEYFYKPFRYTDLRYDYSAIYVVEGTLDIQLDKADLRIKKGEFIITTPGASRSHGTNCNGLSYFWLTFTGDTVVELIEKMKLQLDTIYHIGVVDEIRNCYRRMAEEFSLNDELFKEVSVAVLTELMALFSRKVHTNDKSFQRSMEYVKLHYHEDIAVETLAQLEGLSISYYRMLFKKKFHTTPNEYITMKRVNAACFLLRHDTGTIDQVSRLVGYSDSFYFSRVFKKKTGMTPSQYRRNS